MLKKSIDEKKAALGRVTEVRSSAEMSVTSQSERDTAMCQSKTNLRSSLENPIKEVDEQVDRPEVARNTEDAKEVSEYYDEEEEEYYDEEENEMSHSQSKDSRRS